MSIWGILGAVAGIIVAIVATLTFFETRRNHRDNEEKKNIKKEKKEFIEELRNIVKEDRVQDLKKQEKNLVTRKKFFDSYDKLAQKIDKMDEKLTGHFKETIKSDLFSLSSEIIAYAEDLKAGLKKSSVAYQHICESYNRYVKLGGNSYIKEVFSWIQEKMKE